MKESSIRLEAMKKAHHERFLESKKKHDEKMFFKYRELEETMKKTMSKSKLKEFLKKERKKDEKLRSAEEEEISNQEAKEEWEEIIKRNAPEDKESIESYWKMQIENLNPDSKKEKKKKKKSSKKKKNY